MKTKPLILLILAAAFLLPACKKSSNNKKTTITSTYYFKGTLNGQAVTWQAAIDGTGGYYVGASASMSRDLGLTTGELTGLLSATAGYKPQLGVGFKTFQVSYDQDIPAYFNSFVNTGPWPLAENDSQTAGVKAVTIYYTDGQGKAYSSRGSQAGNSANVLAVSPVAARIGSNEGLKIKLIFSCTLYPAEGTGAALSLTNAEATVLVEDQLY